MTPEQTDAIVRQAGEETGTVSSLDLVEIINGQRVEFDARIVHYTFLETVEKVLGDTCRKFLGTYRTRVAA